MGTKFIQNYTMEYTRLAPIFIVQSFVSEKRFSSNRENLFPLCLHQDFEYLLQKVGMCLSFIVCSEKNGVNCTICKNDKKYVMHPIFGSGFNNGTHDMFTEKLAKRLGGFSSVKLFGFDLFILKLCVHLYI